jgi:CO/xanthine dehydrogenase FAD-binding subunit
MVSCSFKGSQPSAKAGGVDPIFRSASLEAASRIRVPVLPVSERIKSMDVEDTTSLGSGVIEMEASRCFNCGCLAVSPSDIAISLVALDATIVTTKRTLDAQSFFTASATGSTALDADELVTEIQIPKPKDGVRRPI